MFTVERNDFVDLLAFSKRNYGKVCPPVVILTVVNDFQLKRFRCGRGNCTEGMYLACSS